MKLSNATILALFATSAFVSAAPAVVTESSLVKRTDANEVLELLAELKQLTEKRDYAEGDEHFALSKRADSVILQLISALSSSGIISEIWQTLTTDEAVKSEIKALIKSALQTAVVQGPALIKAVWNSGLIKNIFQTLLHDGELRSALLAVAKSIFSNALNLLKIFKSGSSSSGATTAATTSTSYTTAAAKRELYDSDSEYLEKKDLASVVSYIVTQIKDSGIISSLINKVLADPEKSISLLTSALKEGLIIMEDVYSLAKSSGILQKGLDYLAENGSTYASIIASFLGEQISSGNVTTSEIDNAYTYSSTIVGTEITSTATSTQAIDSILAVASKAEAALTDKSYATTLVRRAY